MKIYKVKELKNNGKTVNNIHKIPSNVNIYEYLNNIDVVYKEVEEIKNKTSLFSHKNKITEENLKEFLLNLSLLLESGVALLDSLDDIEEEVKPEFKFFIKDLKNGLKNGESITSIMKKYKGEINPNVLSLIQIGEETGNLNNNLKKAAILIEKNQELKKKIKKVMYYPIFQIILIIGVMIFWIVGVLPEMLPMIVSEGVELPATTKFLIALTPTKIFTFLGFIISVVIIVKLLLKFSPNKKHIKYKLDKLSLKTPFIKDFINSYYEYITTDMLALSVSSGISIVSSIEMVLKDINNLVYKEKMKKVLTKIKEGETLTNSFKSEKLFSPFIIRMIKVGEESGRLENQLEFVSKKSQEKLDELSARLPKIIEPIIMFVVAGFLILMVTALMGPMYDMISKLN